MSRPPRPLVATCLLAAGVAALYLAFVGYGYQLEDEGTILFQILRTYRGERPYLDFHTGYTPAIFHLNAGLFQLFGVSVLPIRLSLALVNSVAVVLIFRLALRFAPPAEAALAALAYAVFMPFFAGQFAAFNIPYPAWHAIAAWLATEIASVRAVEGGGSRRWLLAAGGWAGVAFSFKPNTGVLALGAALLSQLLASAPAAGRAGRLVEGTILLGAWLGVMATLHFELLNLHFVLIGGALWLLIGAALPLRLRARRGAERPLGALVADLGTIVAGFGAVSALWLAYYLPRLGLQSFLRDVLLIGAGVERIYLLLYPWISWWNVGLLAVVLAVLLLPHALARGRLGRRGLAALATLAAAGAVAALLAFAYAPEGLATAVVLQLENASFYLLPLLLLAAVFAWIARQRAAARPPVAGGPRERGVATVALVYALLLFLQLHPRIDFMHIVITLPSALVLAAGALVRLEERWTAALAGPDPSRRAVLGRRVRAGALAALVAVLALRAWPLVDARLETHPRPRVRPLTRLDGTPMPVGLERDRDHDLRTLAAVVRFVRRATRPEEPIVVFPALAMVPFLADRRTPWRDDYFFSGRPPHAEEAAMVAAIDAARPPLVVTLNDRLGYFSHAPAYYFILRDHVRRHYVLARRYGRYDVLVRRDRPHPRPATRLGAPDPFATTHARGHYRRVVRAARRIAARGAPAELAAFTSELAQVDRYCRRAAVLAAAGVATRAPGGFAAAAAVLAPGPRTRLLLLRGLGEFGDERALPFLLEEYRGAPSRLRHEAGTAVNYILARRLAARFALGSPDPGPAWRFPPGLSTAALGRMATRRRDRSFTGVLASLVVAQAGAREWVPSLERLGDDLAKDNWTRMMTALALVQLGEQRHLLTLFDTLNRGTLPGQYVPSMLLDPAFVPPAAAVGCVLARLREGTEEERETAAWMAPFVVPDVAVAAAVAEATRDRDPAVRHAATWAAGRLAPLIAAAPATPRAPRARALAASGGAVPAAAPSTPCAASP